MKEARRIFLGTICGGGVGALLVLLLEKIGVEADLRFLMPVLCVIFVSSRDSIFK